MEHTVTDQDLERLLLDPECRWGFDLRPGGNLPIFVRDLLTLARTRFPDAEHLEESLDDYIVGLGGTRFEVVDLDDLFQRVVRRLRGRESRPTSYAYEVPRSFFAERGRRDPRRVRWEAHVARKRAES